MIRIDEDSPKQLETTSLASEGLYEEGDLHEWFIRNPRLFLQEELLVIGREIQLQATGDRIDVLGIDRDGNVAVVELKRGNLSSGVEFQGLNYVSQIADWGYEDIQRQFDQFKKSEIGRELYSEESILEEKLNEFCDENSTPNRDQRLIYIGDRIRPRVEKITNWLHSHDVDVTVVRFDLYKDNERLYLDPRQVIPDESAVVRERETGPSKQPWKEDGRGWHLQKTNSEMGELLQDLVVAFDELDVFDELSWNQRYYVAFYIGRGWRVKFSTKKTMINIYIRLPEQKIKQLDAESLGSEIGISHEKVTIETDGRSRISVTCSSRQELDVEALRDRIAGLL